MTTSYETEVSTESTRAGLQELVNKECEHSCPASFILKHFPPHVSRKSLGEVLIESALEYNISIDSDFIGPYNYMLQLLLQTGSHEIKEITQQIIEYDQKMDRIINSY
ncbi:MAG: hypothetical protein Q8R37_05520 [Nanoarchaeota archaeon]|nr:hypothetical protein [Nanoarchaeota archaeon]